MITYIRFILHRLRYDNGEILNCPFSQLQSLIYNMYCLQEQEKADEERNSRLDVLNKEIDEVLEKV